MPPELVHYPTWDRVGGKQRTLSAYLYTPKTPGPHPVLVSIHGGPEEQYRPGYEAFFQFLVNELGYASIAPNVRGSSGYGKSFLKLDNGLLREDSVKDIGSLLVWIGVQPMLDRDRVVVMGGSYGGYMTLASLVSYSDRLRGGVDVVGISNFNTFLNNTSAYRRDLRRAGIRRRARPEDARVLLADLAVQQLHLDPAPAAGRAGAERPARARIRVGADGGASARERRRGVVPRGERRRARLQEEVEPRLLPRNGSDVPGEAGEEVRPSASRRP